jgi:hypothetical protein
VAKGVKQLAQSLGDQPAGQGQRRARELAVDAQLVGRRAAGEPWRALAGDSGVSHTTLVHFFARPEVAKQLGQAGQQLRAERRAEARREAEFKREVLRRAKEQAASERALRAARAQVAAGCGRRRGRDSAYMAWLDERDNRLPLSRADLYSRSDDAAASAVAAGGGIEDVIEATGLRTHDNVLERIDAAILKQALQNDAVRAVSARSIT